MKNETVIIPDVPRIIMQQVGGNAAFAMMGTSSINRSDSAIQFDVKGCRKINRIRISYDHGSDVYRLEMFKIRKFTFTLIADHDGVYGDQLKPMIESETGLYLNL